MTEIVNGNSVEIDVLSAESICECLYFNFSEVYCKQANRNLYPRILNYWPFVKKENEPKA